MVYLVSGFMRSGTSMLMQALEAGGMSVARSPRRDRFNDAHADALYRPNPEGLYEPALNDLQDPAWWRSQDGRAVKCVVPWLQWLPVHGYRVVFLRRDPEEIRQSFEAAFGERLTRQRIETAAREAERTLTNRRDVHSFIPVEYRWVTGNALSFFRNLRWQHGWPLDPERAAAAVDPQRCRFRRECLVEGL